MAKDRDRATQDQLLTIVVDRLRSRIPEYNGATCFLSDQEVPPVFPPGPVCCTVSLGNGTFPQDLFAGGGHVTIFKMVALRVSPFVRCDLDKVQDAREAMVGRDRGLFSRFEGRILSALLCEEKDGDVVAWEPCDSEGVKLLRNQLSPKSVSSPQPTPHQPDWLMMTIEFSLDFDWQIS